MIIPLEKGGGKGRAVGLIMALGNGIGWTEGGLLRWGGAVGYAVGVVGWVLATKIGIREG